MNNYYCEQNNSEDTILIRYVQYDAVDDKLYKT